VLRRQISRVRYQPGDRLWLAALSWADSPAGVGYGVRGDARDTARLALAAGRTQVGRHQPPTSRAAAHCSRDPKLVIRVATDNPRRVMR